MSVQFAETAAYEQQRLKAGHRKMKFTFPPESKPLNGYTIKRAIHRGGFGEVYYAISDGGKEVALKLLRDNLEGELRGVQSCLNIKHPNLVTIFDVMTDDDGDHWVVMEYVAGKNLATVIDEVDGPLPLEDVKQWFSGVAAGLAHLHDRGIVHRDLKPANVFSEAGAVKLGDVGLSKIITESRRSQQTQSVGTLYYMAPEVTRGQYGQEVDIYSLGIVLYEMLTGRVPFMGESAGEILNKHLTERPDLTPLPKMLRSVLAHALEKDPAKRTPSVAQFENEFNAALNGKEVPQEIPPESFTGLDDPNVTVEQLAQEYREKAKQMQVKAKKAAKALAKAVKDEHRENRKQRRKQRHKKRRACRPDIGCKTQPVSNRSVQPKQTQSSPFTQVVKFAAIVLVLLALFAPSAALSWMKLIFIGGIFATFIYGGYRVFGMMTAPLTPGVLPQVANHVRHLKPETLRTVPPRFRIADLTGTMAYAVVITALVTVGTWAAMPGMFANSDAGNLALFAITTLLGAWAVIVPSKLWEGTTVQPHVRRLVLVGTGAIAGAAGYWLHQNLMVDVHYTFGSGARSAQALFDQAGSRSLIVGNYQPSLAGYMIFFGALFGIRRWWRHADSLRKKRFRVSSLLLTGLAGFVLPLVFAFPQMWGLMWAVAISIVVQLSSIWATPDDRQRLLEARTHDV